MALPAKASGPLLLIHYLMSNVKKTLDENSDYVYIQERNIIPIIIFRSKGYYYTCTGAYT